MTKMMAPAAAAIAAMMLGGCIRDARIALPGELTTATETYKISGMGFGRRGDFTFAGSEGQFTRGADRLEFFDSLLIRNSGAGTFRYAGLEGACRYREKEVNVGSVSTRTKPFAYRCLFGRNGAPAGELVIGEELGTTGAMLGKRGREGYLLFDGVHYEISSIHRFDVGGLANANALGYRFDADGRAVGAVDVNGPTKTVYAPRGGAAREAVFAGSLALSVLWDPATL